MSIFEEYGALNEAQLSEDTKRRSDQVQTMTKHLAHKKPPTYKQIPATEELFNV